MYILHYSIHNISCPSAWPNILRLACISLQGVSFSEPRMENDRAGLLNNVEDATNEPAFSFKSIRTPFVTVLQIIFTVCFKHLVLLYSSCYYMHVSWSIFFSLCIFISATNFIWFLFVQGKIDNSNSDAEKANIQNEIYNDTLHKLHFQTIKYWNDVLAYILYRLH